LRYEGDPGGSLSLGESGGAESVAEAGAGGEAGCERQSRWSAGLYPDSAVSHDPVRPQP
jgi:hypothetical protein